jgi:3-methyladenine DNA glycosylase AlkD
VVGTVERPMPAPDELFLHFLSLAEREADDPRNFVRKAVNWALRQIGKRNMVLNRAAVAVCRRLATRAGSARWVATDAIRELTSERTLARVVAKARRHGPSGGCSRV